MSHVYGFLGDLRRLGEGMKFSSSVQLPVGNGELITFSSDAELLSWFEAQSLQWGTHAALVNAAAAPIPNAVNWINEHAGLWSAHLNEVKSQILQTAEEEKISRVRAFLDRLRSRLQQSQMLWSGDDVAQRVLTLADVDAEASIWLLMLALGHARWYLVDNANRMFWAGMAKAIQFLAEPKSVASFHKKQRAAIANIENLTGAATEKLGEIAQSIAKNEEDFALLSETSSESVVKLVGDSSEAAAQQRSGFEQEWAKLRGTYDAQMKLRAPREYWQSKFNDHKNVASNWRTGFFCTAAAAAVAISLGLASLILQWIPIPNSLGALRWIVPAGVVGIPAFLSLWLLRFCGRQWSDHLMRREDSRERVVMIETFLAISRDSDSPSAISDPAQLGLVLASIFRPGPGMTKDDSPPAGFFEAFLTRFSNQHH